MITRNDIQAWTLGFNLVVILVLVLAFLVVCLLIPLWERYRAWRFSVRTFRNWQPAGGTITSPVNFPKRREAPWACPHGHENWDDCPDCSH